MLRTIILAMLLASVATAANPSEVTVAPARIDVLILDESTGKPIPGISLLIGVSRGNSNRNKLRPKTDSKGFASFNFVDTVPDRFSLVVGPEIEMCPRSFPTAQVLSSGLVQNFECGEHKFEYSEAPKPGELVVFARRVNVLERMVREL